MFSQPKISIQKHEKRGKIRIDVTHIQFTEINFQALDRITFSSKESLTFNFIFCYVSSLCSISTQTNTAIPTKMILHTLVTIISLLSVLSGLLFLIAEAAFTLIYTLTVYILLVHKIIY